MTRPTFAAAAGFAVVIGLGFVGFGCSSGSTSGTGGATGSGGAATGGSTGTGGKAGTGGATGAGGAVDAGPTLPMCTGSPADKSACNSDPSCVKNCGLNISALTSTERALKPCTCSGPMSSGGMWSCPSTNGACVYPKDIDLSCFNLPSPLPLCVLATDGGTADGGPDGGAALIKSGSTPCTPPSSEVCGGVCGSASANVNSYVDNSNNPHAGYCACIAGVYQCASVNEWPPQQ